MHPPLLPASGSLVQLGSPCCALVLREGEFPEAVPERGSRHPRRGHASEVALLCEETWVLRVAEVTISSGAVANPVVSKDACEHVDVEAEDQALLAWKG